jgi:HEPN domain-containing protein
MSAVDDADDNLDINEWIRFAQTDYDCALKLAEVFYPTPIEIICYHCQQSAEKIFKAYTLAKGHPLVKTHDLIQLINQCKQHSPDFDNYTKFCSKLTSYVSVSRYPPKLEITKEDMKQALKNTSKILEFTKSKLKEMGRGYKVN